MTNFANALRQAPQAQVAQLKVETGQAATPQAQVVVAQWEGATKEVPNHVIR